MTETTSMQQGPRVFPIMKSAIVASIPWEFIAPHEAQAYRNHWQSLKRLAERGGLNASEALCIVLGQSWQEAPRTDDPDRQLINLVRLWRAKTLGVSS